MTDQEAFTRIVQHLRTQGGPSADPNGHCLYHHPDGLTRCAIGVLIPDEEYYKSFESKPIDCVYTSCPSLHSISRDLLVRMQRVHDSYVVEKRLDPNIRWGPYMEDKYQMIAKCHDLDVPPHPCTEVSITLNNREEVKV